MNCVRIKSCTATVYNDIGTAFGDPLVDYPCLQQQVKPHTIFSDHYAMIYLTIQPGWTE
ncbi:MAG: hypothetical protein VX435_06820 [Planctomycetota bacterium]|nr:hypothetical protein [Planctomycetota bacterium]